MNRGFWDQLPRPIIGLSPMDGVTDQPFREIVKTYGQPDVVFTEFTSVEGVTHNAVRLFRDFLYSENQRPVVAQIFGKTPAAFRTTALILCYLGFDGIDINMGCPAKNVSQHGSGAGLICTPYLAQDIIRETKAGVQDWVDGKTLDDYPELNDELKTLVLERQSQLSPERRERKSLPVSVKTRVGIDSPSVEEWIPYLLEMEPAAITVHGRTLKQLYSGMADWSEISRAVELARGTNTLILGNGDVTSVEILRDRIQETGVDGVLVGRATFGNPWILRDMIAWRNGAQSPELPTVEERVKVVMEHARLFESTFPGHNFLPMRKHMGWYIRDFPNASSFRVQLVLANSSTEVANILSQV